MIAKREAIIPRRQYVYCKDGLRFVIRISKQTPDLRRASARPDSMTATALILVKYTNHFCKINTNAQFSDLARWSEDLAVDVINGCCYFAPGLCRVLLGFGWRPILFSCGVVADPGIRGWRRDIVLIFTGKDRGHPFGSTSGQFPDLARGHCKSKTVVLQLPLTTEQAG